MSTNSNKSAAQVLFDRLVRTWLVPAARARGKRDPHSDHPLALRLALLVWENTREPTVYLNSEVFGKARRVKIIANGPVAKGEPITPEKVKGLTQASLDHRLRGRPFILIMQGQNQKYYLKSHRTETVLKTDDFKSLSANVRETRSTQRIRVGRRQRKRTCWDCEREWKRMVVPLESGRPSEARQLLRTRR